MQNTYDVTGNLITGARKGSLALAAITLPRNREEGISVMLYATGRKLMNASCAA